MTAWLYLIQYLWAKILLGYFPQECINFFQEKVDQVNVAVFASIVPGFPSPLSKLSPASSHRPVDFYEYVISCVSGQGTEHGLFGTNLESEIGERSLVKTFKWKILYIFKNFSSSPQFSPLISHPFPNKYGLLNALDMVTRGRPPWSGTWRQTPRSRANRQTWAKPIGLGSWRQSPGTQAPDQHMWHFWGGWERARGRLVPSLGRPGCGHHTWGHRAAHKPSPPGAPTPGAT